MSLPSLGIDISKLKFDICLSPEGGKFRHKVFPNSPVGCSQLSTWLAGSSVRRKARLSKTGAPRLRKALYFPAIVAIKHNPQIRALGERMTGRGKCPMEIIGAAMRKLVHIAYGVLKSGRPFDPEMAKTA